MGNDPDYEATQAKRAAKLRVAREGQRGAKNLVLSMVFNQRRVYWTALGWVDHPNLAERISITRAQKMAANLPEQFKPEYTENP